MKILHFIEGRASLTTANGVDRVVYRLSEAQAASGAEVFVLSESDKAVNEISGVKVRNVKRTRSCLRLSAEAQRVLAEISPDVIHLHSAYIPTGISIARWARKRKIPYVISPHGNYCRQLGKRGRLAKAVYKIFFELPCAKGAAWVHSMGDGENIRDFGYHGKIEDFPNGISESDVVAPSDESILASRIPSALEKTIFLFLGRLDVEQKGLDLMLQGFAKFHESVPASVLLMVGPGWRNGEEKVKDLADSLNLGSEALLLWGKAFGKEKADLFKAADAFIHTSRWEGFPMAMIEAMSYEKFCITTPAADPLQTITNEKLGVICEPDPDSIAEAMARVAKMSVREREEIGKAARKIVMERFSWYSIATDMVEAYRGTLVGV